MVGTFLDPMQPLDIGAESVADFGVEGEGEDPSLGGENPFRGYDCRAGGAGGNSRRGGR